MNAPEFTLWVVRSKSFNSQSIEPFHGGVLNDPYGQPVHGVFLTEAEAQRHAPELLANRGRVLSHINNPGLYPEPIAWLVTFIILMQSTGDGRLQVEPTFGGECLWNDDRDVMAIFQTCVEAEAFAASQ